MRHPIPCPPHLIHRLDSEPAAVLAAEAGVCPDTVGRWRREHGIALGQGWRPKRVRRLEPMPPRYDEMPGVHRSGRCAWRVIVSSVPVDLLDHIERQTHRTGETPRELLLRLLAEDMADSGGPL